MTIQPPPFRDRIVRDLWWALTSPGVASADYCALVAPLEQSALLPLFEALDDHPAPLHRAVAGSWERDRLRLGAYFEDLVRFFLGQVASYRDVTSGVVISEEKRTVGELDFLFRDGDLCHHWEVAVKFYLHVPGLAEAWGECFVGPQTRDRLHFKMARMRDHQLALAKHAAATEVLAPWQPLKSAALLRGRLFYPASTDWESSDGGASVHPEHQRGWWCTVDRAEEQLPPADSYALLTRREWLAPVDAAVSDLTQWDRRQACAWAAESAATWPADEVRTQVVAGLDADGQELHRGFLVCVRYGSL